MENTYDSAFALDIPSKAQYESVSLYGPCVSGAIRTYLNDHIKSDSFILPSLHYDQGTVDDIFVENSMFNSNVFSIKLNTTTASTFTIKFPINYVQESTSTMRYHGASWTFSKRDHKELMKDIIKSRQFPTIFVPNRKLEVPMDIRETRARETLALLLGEEEYKKFLKNGFVSVKNKISGKIYQIFPGHKFTNVYEDGKMTERLCVVLQGNFPPTDSLIVRYLMVLNNEEKLWELANKHGAFVPRKRLGIVQKNNKSLVDIYRYLKIAA